MPPFNISGDKPPIHLTHLPSQAYCQFTGGPLDGRGGFLPDHVQEWRHRLRPQKTVTMSDGDTYAMAEKFAVYLRINSFKFGFDRYE